MKSSFFCGEPCEIVAEKIKNSINAEPDFLSSLTASSPRATGDAIERLVAQKFDQHAGDWCVEYSSAFARRAMADLAFKDREGFYCVIDVKTHRQETSFNMPALVSVERLSRFYEDDSNIFAILMVQYTTVGEGVEVNEIKFCPIEFLDWGCLTVGALGWGQIQIANSNHILVNRGYSRKEWMLSLCDRMLEFYPREISKIEKRIEKFHNVKTYWQSKQDIWI